MEDLRSALQGSDARCLALEVALRRERSRTLPSPPSFSSTVSTPTSSIVLRQGKLVPTLRIKGHCSAAADGSRRAAKKRDIRDPLVRELKLIRSSRDGQLEEAMRFNERLEEELRWAYQEVCKLQAVEAALRKENAQIRWGSAFTDRTMLQKNGLMMDDLHQEAGGGGQRGSEPGSAEGSVDPETGSVRATAPVQNHPAGGRIAPVQVRTPGVV